MRKLTKQEKDLWARVCSTINTDLKHPTKVKSGFHQTPKSIINCLDLHGINENDAYFELMKLLSKNFYNGSKSVTVITGKGKSGKGILRRLVPYWLDTTLNNYVRSYNFDPKNIGQLIIYLKKN